MGETIESFVAKLQEEGVKAGHDSAEKIRAEADKQADTIAKQAREKARTVIQEAEEQAKTVLERGHTELRLAARDTVLRLRKALGQALEAILASAVKGTLTDVNFMGPLLHDLVLMYAKSDLPGTETIKITVPPEARQKLVDWAMKEIGEKAIRSGDIEIDLKGTLSQAGFEYTTAGATVEVTQDSVVAALKELVSPKLMEVVDEAAAEAGQDGNEQKG